MVMVLIARLDGVSRLLPSRDTIVMVFFVRIRDSLTLLLTTTSILKKKKLSHPPEHSDGLSSPSSPHKRPSRSTPGPRPSASSSAGARDTHDSLLSIDELKWQLKT